MYGKSQQSTPDRAKAKVQKRQQLIDLLVNKFRNKYNINGSTESEIDKLIRDEVSILLNDGNTYEGNLYKLDKKLEQMVKASRSGQPISARQSSQAASRSNARPSAIDVDAQSQRSIKSMRSARSTASSRYAVPGAVVTKVAGSPGMRVTHTDLAADLNPSDEQWNSIVQKNLRNFEEEKKRVKEDKFLRTKKIQEEQKLQMSLKAERFQKQANDELSHFNKIGITASDKFYINQDNRKAREAALKGNAKVVGATMYDNYNSSLEMNRQKMKEEAEERIKINQSLADEDALNKQKKADKKAELRAIQYNDLKRANNNRGGIIAGNQSADFAETSILSYVYEKKVHKAYENRKKNEHLISLMKDQFRHSTYDSQKMDESLIKEELSQKIKFDYEQKKKVQDRKQKEMEIKKYQDIQMEEKVRRKEMELVTKKQDFNKTFQLAQDFEAEQAKKKVERFEKNVNHVKHVKDQMKDPRRQFAKTGIAVIKS